MQLTGVLKFLDIGSGMWMLVTEGATYMIGQQLPAHMEAFQQGTKVTVTAAKNSLFSTIGTANEFIDIEAARLVD